MAARATASGTIQFGLVAVPVKLFTAASSEQARFNLLDPRNGARVKQQYISTVDGEVIERANLVHGYEVSKGQFVTFTKEEIDGLKTQSTNKIDLVEFVPEGSFDLVSIEKSYYLGPDKGADKSYLLLSRVLKDEGKVAIGKWYAKGKEQFVAIRSYNGGLILHQLYYANEVRNFDAIIEGVAKMEFSDRELQLASTLVEQLSNDELDTSQYRDEFVQLVMDAVQKKLAGEEVTAAPAVAKQDIFDLHDALTASLEKLGAGKASKKSSKAPAKKAKRKAS